MEKFKTSEVAIKGALKEELRRFIKNCNSLNDEQKNLVNKELGYNWYDERFNVEKFISHIDYSRFIEWQNNNFKLMDLWTEIAVKNASVNNQPHIVANEAVSVFKKEFNIE
jgi:hypothetical protein